MAPILAKLKRPTAALTAFFFLFQGTALPAADISFSSLKTEVRPQAPFRLELPSELARVEEVYSGDGPAIVHIKTAHGNYEVQKQIEKILEELKNKYGISTVLVEGSASRLDAGLLKFSDDAVLNSEITDDLTRKGIVKGAELFLLKNPDSNAYGVEDLSAYIANGKSFLAAANEREKESGTIRSIEANLEKNSTLFFGESLRKFWKQKQAFDHETVPIMKWLHELRAQARTVLNFDPAEPRYQLDWPMLVRVLTLEKIEREIDLEKFNQEKIVFLTQNRKFLSPVLYGEVRGLLEMRLSQNQLSDPVTSQVFERMAERLPLNFDYGKYPNVSLHIGHLILQSEIKSIRLFEEVERLSAKVLGQLAKTEKERSLLKALQDFEFIKKFTELKLIPSELPEIEKVSAAWKRVRKEAGSSDAGDLAPLFAKAREFYVLAEKRDGILAEKVKKFLAESGQTKIALITGGFHAPALRDDFESSNYSYIQLTPVFSTFDETDTYGQSMKLKDFNFISGAAVEDPFISDPAFLRTPELRDLLDLIVQDRLRGRSELRAKKKTAGEGDGSEESKKKTAKTPAKKKPEPAAADGQTEAQPQETEPAQPKPKKKTAKSKEKPAAKPRTHFSFDDVTGELVRTGVEIPNAKPRDLETDIRDEFEEIMRGFDPNVFSLLAARYSLDIKNILWRLVGSRLNG